MADREADILDLMVRARDLAPPADWLLRAKHNRALPGGEGQKLWGRVLDTEPLGEVRFTVPPGRGRTARTVRQELYAQRVSLSDRRQGHLEVTGVIAREIEAPQGRQTDRMASADQPSSRHARGRRRTDRMVPGALGNRVAVLGAQGRLSGRGPATGHCRALGTRFRAVSGGGMAHRPIDAPGTHGA